ncbi:hypothetical protein P691DRAFT_732792 [Macrolepiota fuliginosa MF-IS2]|uniref:G domain-containing protein n=1 Tax=Macrolepiota fuliginosa MF-IS2 TaxID=1400762 RepID=A0A9P5XCB4_9AGAR|nr:hypothetical protein P691DRAFT_732792 [Macrolepiota fuliginosa MF-IS2]
MIRPEDLLPDDTLIAVMGPRNSGKDRILDVVVRGVGGQVLPQSPPPAIRTYTITAIGRKSQRLVLACFPDFDGSNDVVVLQLISHWLKATYERGLRLTGILYTYRISDFIPKVSDLKDLFIFGQLCGDRALARTTIVTTMWDKVDESEGEGCERMMSEICWKEMLKWGCRTARFDDTFRSAMGILNKLIDSGGEKEPLLVQEELVDLKMLWNETQAGRMLHASCHAALEEDKAELKKTQQGIHTGIIRGRMQWSTQAMKELEIPFNRYFAFRFPKKGKIVSLAGFATVLRVSDLVRREEL